MQRVKIRETIHGKSENRIINHHPQMILEITLELCRE